jgi:signal transduction histidine kinase
MLNKVGYPVAGTQEATTLKPFVRELHLQAEEIFRGAQNYSFLEGVDDYPVSKVLRGQLEAIVTEAFTNIYKYADCTVASLCVEVDENGLTLTMEDNGKGFDPQQVAQSGLRNIELRTYEINGRYKIISEPGKGTQIKIVVPAFPERSE